MSKIQKAAVLSGLKLENYSVVRQIKIWNPFLENMDAIALVD